METSFENFEVLWKHILIGFYFEKNQKIVVLNNIISTLATIINKYKMYCRLLKKDVEESKENISSHVKGSLKTCSCVYKRLIYNIFHDIFILQNAITYISHVINLIHKIPKGIHNINSVV